MTGYAPGAAVETPWFFAVGPQRTATSWLHETLAGAVGLPMSTKETFFFDRFHDNGNEWYERLFAPGAVLNGEVAPTYFHSEEVRLRIQTFRPDARIICSLRDPVERAISLYKLYRSTGQTRESLERAYDSLAEFHAANRYAANVRAWQRVFGRDHVLVVFQEDLKTDPDGFLASICEFLALERPWPQPVRRKISNDDRQPRNDRAAELTMRASFWLRRRGLFFPIEWGKRLGLRRLLFGGGEPARIPSTSWQQKVRADLRQDIEELEQLTGRDLSHWKARE